MKFFNPLTDMEIATQPTEPTDKTSAQADITLADGPKATQSRTSTSAPPVQSSFPQSSFIGLGSLILNRRPNEAGPSLLRELPWAEGSGPNSNAPPTMDHLTLQASTSTRSTWSYPEPFHRRLQRQGSLHQPSSSPTNSQSPGVAATSKVTAHERKDSREDVEAQRGIPCLLNPLFTADDNCST